MTIGALASISDNSLQMHAWTPAPVHGTMQATHHPFSIGHGPQACRQPGLQKQWRVVKKRLVRQRALQAIQQEVLTQTSVMLCVPESAAQHRRPSQPYISAGLTTEALLQAKRLTQNISAATCWQDLMNLLSYGAGNINHIHVSAMLCKFAKVAAPGQLRPGEALAAQQLLPTLAGMLSNCLQHMGPQGVANSIWALAKLQYLPKPHLLQQLMGKVDEFSSSFEPQHYSSVLYALALWQQQLLQRLEASDKWEQAGWRHDTFARGGLPSGNTPAAGGALDFPLWFDSNLAQQWLHTSDSIALHPEAYDHPTHWQQQHHTNQRQQQQRQQQRPDRLLELTGMQQPAVLLQVANQQLGLSPTLLNKLLHHAAQKFPQFGAQALSNVFYAVARLGGLSSSVQSEFDQSRSSGGQPSSPHQQASWLSAFWEASRDLMHTFTPQHLSNVMWAAARLSVTPPKPWVLEWLHCSQNSMGRFEPQGHSNSLWGLAVLGIYPGHDWMHSYLSASALQLDAFPEQALSNCCWAVAKVAQGQDYLEVQPWLQQCSSAPSSSSTGSSSKPDSSSQQTSSKTNSSRHSSTSTTCDITAKPMTSSVKERQAVLCDMLAESSWLSKMLRVSLGR